MATIDVVKTFVEYHIAMTRRVWDSIDRISEEQFLADDAYSRGSIRNLMVHLTNTDGSWLAGLKNLPDVREQLQKHEEYPNRLSVRVYWDSVRDLAEYVNNLGETEVNQNPTDIPGPRWEVLHIVNHGTDHRSTVLQKLTEYDAPTFDQDFITWLADTQ